jgi:hypothetical protein
VSVFQAATTIGMPITVVIVMVLLIVVARPDRDPDGDGLYAVYLATVSLTTLYILLVSATGLAESIARTLHCRTTKPDWART